MISHGYKILHGVSLHPLGSLCFWYIFLTVYYMHLFFQPTFLRASSVPDTVLGFGDTMVRKNKSIFYHLEFILW